MTFARIPFVLLLLLLFVLPALAGWSRIRIRFGRRRRSSGGCSARHCEWNNWGGWGSCDDACGPSGMQHRQRTKRQEASCGGNECVGDSEKSKPCNRLCLNGGSVYGWTCRCTSHYYGPCCEQCISTHCKWNDWGPWSTCDQTCGGSGVQHRQRSKESKASCGGNECVGDSEKSKPCNRFCHNGGSVYGGTCRCTSHYHGPCCEHHNPKQISPDGSEITLYVLIAILTVVIGSATIWYCCFRDK